MHLIKTREGSQFYKFPENSHVAAECLTAETPMIKDREVEILQVASMDNGHHVIIEFIYKVKSR